MYERIQEFQFFECFLDSQRYVAAACDRRLIGERKRSRKILPNKTMRVFGLST
jgi:hypothetical protein